MPTINTTDNNWKKKISCEAKDQLEIFAGKTLQSITQDYRRILVFPSSSSIESDQIYSIENEFNNGELTYLLKTQNIMGFINVNNIHLNIYSRFTKDSDKKNAEDYFMHYMLSKISDVNIVDLSSQYTLTSTFDYLSILFPAMLAEALKQGIYKEYVKRNYNDSNIKGRIDVNRQISRNTPFNGRVAYSTSEQSYDNCITQLIRHTIEYMKCTDIGRHVLQFNTDITENVQTIYNCTRSYTSADKSKVLQANRQPLVHPYFTAYKALQQLCLVILQHKQFKYEENTNQSTYGLLFDGAWLWEEYLAKLLVTKDLQYKHAVYPQEHPLHIFSGQTSHYSRYPDFYKEGSILDAKYKRFDTSIQRHDLHQMITYIHITKSPYAGLIYPVPQQEGSTEMCLVDNLGEINGYGGSMLKIGVVIPQDCTSYKEFVEAMSEVESGFISKVANLI